MIIFFFYLSYSLSQMLKYTVSNFFSNSGSDFLNLCLIRDYYSKLSSFQLKRDTNLPLRADDL